MKKIADCFDLFLEVWFRARNSGELVWKTKTGEVIPVKDMSWSHLVNTINYLQKKNEIEEIVNENDIEVQL